jgi:hypothetical protein
MKFKNYKKLILSTLCLFFQITTYSQNVNADIEKKWKDLDIKNQSISKENASKGNEKNKKNITKFKLIENVDRMSGESKLIAVYESNFGQGSFKVELECQSKFKKIIPLFTFYDINVTTTEEQLGFSNQKTDVAYGRLRVNEKISNYMFINSTKFSNQFTAPSLDENQSYIFHKSDWIGFNGNLEVFKNEEIYKACKESASESYTKCKKEFSKIMFSTEPIVRNTQVSQVFDLAIEIPTNYGPFFIEINPFDPPIRKVIESCVR